MAGAPRGRWRRDGGRGARAVEERPISQGSSLSTSNPAPDRVVTSRCRPIPTVRDNIKEPGCPSDRSGEPSGVERNGVRVDYVPVPWMWSPNPGILRPSPRYARGMGRTSAAVRAVVPPPMPGRVEAYQPGAACLSPLRYPGAKRRLVSYVADALSANGLSPELFVEPFAGGASVALQLASDRVVDAIGLADRDNRVASFWSSVFWDTAWLIDQIEAVPLDLPTWRSFKSSTLRSERDRALACLYLNRTSFSGILAPRAGPIGGTSGASSYDIGCRFPRATLVRRVRQVAALKDRVRFVWSLDWRTVIGRVRSMQSRGRLPDHVFYYLDPPFFYRAERLYDLHFEDRDHRRLQRTLCSMKPDKEPWLLSYDSLADVQHLYGDMASRIVTIDRIYTASRLVKSQPLFAEALVTNMPHCPEPRRLALR